MSRPDHAAHLVHQEGRREVDSLARRRAGEIAEILSLHPSLRALFLMACERMVHLDAADCARIDHELRSGRRSPAEDDVTREAIQQREWTGSLADLGRAVTRLAETGAREAPERESDRRYHVHYRPLVSLTRSR